MQVACYCRSQTSCAVSTDYTGSFFCVRRIFLGHSPNLLWHQAEYSFQNTFKGDVLVYRLSKTHSKEWIFILFESLYWFGISSCVVIFKKKYKLNVCKNSLITSLMAVEDRLNHRGNDKFNEIVFLTQYLVQMVNLQFCFLWKMLKPLCWNNSAKTN